jgi:hypothetical protein
MEDLCPKIEYEQEKNVRGLSCNMVCRQQCGAENAVIEFSVKQSDASAISLCPPRIRKLREIGARDLPFRRLLRITQPLHIPDGCLGAVRHSGV